MTGKRKSAGAVGRAGRSKADLGQKEAQLEKTQAELEEASEAQLRHMEGGKDAKAAGQQKAKIRSKQRERPASEIRLFLWRWFALEGADPKPTPFGCHYLFWMN